MPKMVFIETDGNRKEVEAQEGRKLNAQEAAKEWISKYAGDFPAL